MREISLQAIVVLQTLLVDGVRSSLIFLPSHEALEPIFVVLSRRCALIRICTLLDISDLHLDFKAFASIWPIPLHRTLLPEFFQSFDGFSNIDFMRELLYGKAFSVHCSGEK
uniref:Secreted protein n=1 Tax=Angiostrongylus cantonensis TaxID=6313 RepID=A0A0K0CW60_ANGCA